VNSDVRTLAKDWTGIEIERARQGLEDASALILGRMIFAFSRLEMVLGLALVWSDGGAQLDRLSKLIADFSFHKKLDFLQQCVDAKYKGENEPSSLYAKWLEHAHLVRITRNELVHGRWGIEPMKNQVINVIGLPTSPEQRERAYTITELRAALDQMSGLQVRLAELRERWPF
jgi:hypothetical protein